MRPELLSTFLSRKFILYCVIGVSGVTLDTLLFYALTKGFGLHYQYAQFFGVSLGITNNFVWNALLNFKVFDRILVRYVQFYLVGLVGMITGMILLFVFIEKLAVPVMLSKVLVVFVVTIIQYSLNTRVALKRRPQDST